MTEQDLQLTSILALGQELQKARLNMNLSIQDVAEKTNIAEHHIVAFENQNIEDFPEVHLILGCIQDYCNILNFSKEQQYHFSKLFKKFAIQNTPKSTVLKLPNIPPKKTFVLLTKKNILNILNLGLLIFNIWLGTLFYKIFITPLQKNTKSLNQSHWNKDAETSEEVFFVDPPAKNKQ